MTGVGVFPSLGKDENDMLEFNMNTEKNVEKLIRIATMVYNNEGFLNKKATGTNSGGLEVFKSGRALFYNEVVSVVGSLRDMEDDFGIIPGPKYDEAQTEYYSLGGNPYFMLVPVCAPDLDKTGLMMEALAYESVGIIDVAFYDTYLSTKTTRDEESSAMLDIIFGNLTYYHPVARSQVCGGVTNRLWQGKTDFASYFASNEELINGMIEEAIAAYEANAK